MNGMRMQSLRSRWMAWWLLLLLGRVMTPEAAVLRLHTHQHTVEEPAQLTAARRDSRAVLSAQHTHCHAEQLYDAPALLAGAVAVPEPVRRLRFAPLASPAIVGQPVAVPFGQAGRGPPVT